MIKINSRAKRVMDKLTQNLNEPGDHRTFDKTNGTFMAVHVEHTGNTHLGPMFSVAHYYEQNGDMMKDPDMVFIRGHDGEYYPIEFQQDNVGLYQCAVRWEDGKITGVNVKLQTDLARFAAMWMKNIKAQQKL